MKLYQRNLIIAIFPPILIILICIAISSRFGETLIAGLYQKKTNLELQLHAEKISNFFREKLLTTKLLASSPSVRSASPEEALAFLKAEYRWLSDDFEGLYYNDKNGNVLGIHGEAFNVRDRSYFDQIDRGEIVFTDVIKSRGTQNRIVLLLVPVFNDKQERTGAVGAAIQVERLLAELRKIDPGEGEITILLGSGKTLVSTGNFEEKDETDFLRQIDSSTVISHKKVTIQNEQYTASSLVIEPGGWTIIKALQDSKIRKEAQGPLKIIFIIAGVVTIIAGLLAIFLSYKVLHPIKSIFETLKKLSCGNLSARIGKIPLTELGDIARAINVMAASLEQKNQELEELNITLEKKVRDRTLSLESVNKELEAFSYSVSHDLRTPLRSIDGFSQALVEDYSDKLGKDALDYLKRVRAASQRMGQLIDGMLQLSKVNRSNLQKVEVDLSHVAQEIVNNHVKSMPVARATFTIRPNMKVKGDPVLIPIILENLFSNAIKFSSKKEFPVIEFGEISETDAAAMGFRSKKVLFVKDNGAGFDMAYENKLFRAFQRLHTIEEFEGTGIGLATILRIINEHGGQIKAEGKPGEGATFYFSMD
ncbi:MAG: hypothetical protein A2283_08525 [Lentisphaerae bacterium RIFOXYA12_FULL_48_11]|nr:MAG: hypothetical protein A2283_08525 [Lentisphaerae bacterium RIFOXYA12_FULL_48_11]